MYKKLFLVLMFIMVLFSFTGLTSASYWGIGGPQINDTNPYPLLSTFTISTIGGMKFVVNNNSILTTIEVNHQVSASKAYLWNSSKGLLATADIVNYNASFNYSLVKGNTYYVVVDASGSSYQDAYLNGGASYPQSGSIINWTGCYFQGGDNNNYAENIQAIYTSLSSTVTLNSPANNYNSNINNILFNCSASISGSGNLVNSSLFLNNILNITNIISGKSNTTTFSKNLSDGTYNWTCQACDSDGACGVGSNRTLIVDHTSVVNNSVTYDTPVIQLSTGSYRLNLTYDTTYWTSSYAYLNYKGIDYSTTQTISGNNISFYSSIALQNSFVGNNTFYWKVYLTNSSSYTSNYNSLCYWYGFS